MAPRPASRSFQQKVVCKGNRFGVTAHPNPVSTFCYVTLCYVLLCYGIGADPCFTMPNPLRRAKRVAQERCEAASCHKDLVAQNLVAQERCEAASCHKDLVAQNLVSQERCEAASCHKDWVGQNLVAQQCKLIFRISFSLTKKNKNGVYTLES